MIELLKKENLFDIYDSSSKLYFGDFSKAFFPHLYHITNNDLFD